MIASKILWMTGSSVFAILGILHLGYTFLTKKMAPQEEEVMQGMKNSAIRLTKQTTVWKAWVGFNASHAAGAVFFGLINLLLATIDFYVVNSNISISFLSIATAVFYLWLAKKYWFTVPFAGIAVATACLFASVLCSYA